MLTTGRSTTFTFNPDYHRRKKLAKVTGLARGPKWSEREFTRIATFAAFEPLFGHDGSVLLAWVDDHFRHGERDKAIKRLRDAPPHVVMTLLDRWVAHSLNARVVTGKLFAYVATLADEAEGEYRQELLDGLRAAAATLQTGFAAAAEVAHHHDTGAACDRGTCGSRASGSSAVSLFSASSGRASAASRSCILSRSFRASSANVVSSNTSGSPPHTQRSMIAPYAIAQMAPMNRPSTA